MALPSSIPCLLVSWMCISATQAALSGATDGSPVQTPGWPREEINHVAPDRQDLCPMQALPRGPPASPSPSGVLLGRSVADAAAHWAVSLASAA